MAEVVIDDFEDGDIVVSGANWSGWDGSTDKFSADSGSPISGSFSGRADATGNNFSLRTTRSSAVNKGLECTIRIDSQTGDASDFTQVEFTDAVGGSTLLTFYGNGAVESDGAQITTWAPSTQIDIRFEPDFDTDEVEVYVDDTLEATQTESFSGLHRILFEGNYFSSGSSVSSYIDDVTAIGGPLPAPTLSIDDTRPDQIDISTTLPTDAEEVDLFRSESFPVSTSDTLVNTYTSAGQFTDTGLENGERYYYAAVARDTDGDRPDSELSAEVDTITTLPAPTVDSSTSDSQTEITLNWTLNDNSTDGDVDIVRDASVVGTVAIGTTTFQDTGLTEATSYDYEIRRNTDHASTDSAVDTQFTKPNAPTGLSATAQDSDATVDLSWADNSSGEDGYEILEERDSSGQTQIASEPANTTTFSTGKKDRVSSYEYQVRAFVGTGSERASSLSNTDTISFTTYDNYWCTVTPPGGSTELFTAPHVSYVDLEHTAIHGAGVVLGNIDADIANWGPKTDIQIYLDDERIFAGEIIRLREDTPSEGETDTTAKGPVKELENAGPTGSVTYSDTLAYLAIDDYFTNEITGIDVNATVYTPPETTVQNDTKLISSDFDSFSTLVTTDLSDVPVTTSGSILLEESAFIATASEFDGVFFLGDDTTDPIVNPHIAQEFAKITNSGDNVSEVFTPQHDIPSERVGVAIHGDAIDTAVGNIADYPFTFNGVEIDTLPFLDDGNRWSIYPNAYDNGSGADLTAGNNYTINFELQDSDAEYDIDGLVVYDTQYVGGTFADITSIGETLDNPVPHNPVEVAIETEPRPNAIKSARVETTASNIGADFRHRVSVTGEDSELTSTSADDTFNFFTSSQYGTILEPFIRLDGEGSNVVFSSGVNAQEVTSLSYFVTTVDTEVIEELQLTGSHYDNVQQLHQLARFNFVTDPRFDPDIDGIVIESFLPGSPDSQKPVDWTTDDVDVEREFDGYANAITVVYQDSNGDTQTFRGVADSSEVAKYGEVRKTIIDTTISTNDEARIVSEREKRKRIARDTTTGEIQTVASFTLPGYSYNISEFGGYTTMSGRVSYREGASDVTMNLKFKPDKDNVQRLLETQEELERVKES